MHAGVPRPRVPASLENAQYSGKCPRVHPARGSDPFLSVSPLENARGCHFLSTTPEKCPRVSFSKDDHPPTLEKARGYYLYYNSIGNTRGSRVFLKIRRFLNSRKENPEREHQRPLNPPQRK